MNQYEFSRAAAKVANKNFKTFAERDAFVKACEQAIRENPDNPLEVLDPQYKVLFDQEVRTHPKAQAAENILRHLPGKHNQKSHGGGRVKFGTKTNAQVWALTQGIVEKAKVAEPEITNLMEQLANTNNGELIGLKNRLKGAARIDEKIKSDALEEKYDGNFEMAAADIGDSIRYTMQLNESDYSQGVVNTIESLQEAGYKTRVKNFWQEGNTYKGVNAVVTSPDGQIFELQFHTAKSLVVKEINHKLYEVVRKGTLSPEKIYDINVTQAANWVDVPNPNNLNLLDSVATSIVRGA